MWFFCYFIFEKDYNILKSKPSYFLLNKNLKFNKNEVESKMKNPPHPTHTHTHTFREMNSVLHLIQESGIKINELELAK